MFPSAEKALEVFHGLIIDAAAAMDEGMETCSGDILGDEEEVIPHIWRQMVIIVDNWYCCYGYPN